MPRVGYGYRFLMMSIDHFQNAVTDLHCVSGCALGRASDGDFFGDFLLCYWYWGERSAILAAVESFVARRVEPPMPDPGQRHCLTSGMVEIPLMSLQYAKAALALQHVQGILLDTIQLLHQS